MESFKDKAEGLISDFIGEIDQSDFHVPKFISGVNVADGSKKYNDVYNSEARLLAINCAILCVDNIKESVLSVADSEINAPLAIYWLKVRKELCNALLDFKS